MSTLRTNAILDASGGTTATVNGYTPTASNMSGRNLIINGAMQVAQRGTSASPAPSGYLIDRFATFKSGAGTFSLAQSSDAPVGFNKSLLATVTSASTPSGGDYYIIQYAIEGQDFSVLAQGTANAQTSTLSFYVKSSLTGTFSGSLRDGSSSVSYVFAYTINSANTWERKSVTISGTTGGTFPTNNTAGARLAFSLGQGTTYATSTVGSWVSGNFHGSTTETDFIATSGATFYLTGVQLEVGSTATPFEHRSYGQELALCQRYFLRLNGGGRIGVGGWNSSTAADVTVPFPVEMRAVPSGSAPSRGRLLDFAVAWHDITSVSFNESTSILGNVVANVASSAAAQGDVAAIGGGGSVYDYLFDAEI